MTTNIYNAGGLRLKHWSSLGINYLQNTRRPDLNSVEITQDSDIISFALEDVQRLIDALIAAVAEIKQIEHTDVTP